MRVRRALFWGIILFVGLGVQELLAQTPPPEATPQAFKPPLEVQKQVSKLFILLAQVQEEIRDKKLRHEHRENYHDNFGADKDIYFSPNGRVRDYVTGFGSDDSAVEFSYIYDGEGRLRVVVAHAGYVNGNRSDDQTIFLDEKGEILEVIHEQEENGWDAASGEYSDKTQKTKEILDKPLPCHEVKVDLKLDPLKDYKADFEM